MVRRPKNISECVSLLVLSAIFAKNQMVPGTETGFETDGQRGLCLINLPKERDTLVLNTFFSGLLSTCYNSFQVVRMGNLITNSPLSRKLNLLLISSQLITNPLSLHQPHS